MITEKVTTAQRIEEKIRKVKPILVREYGVKSIGYFGSYAKGNSNESSDVDMLVDFSSSIGWKFFDLKEYLEEVIGQDIDLVTPGALKKRLKESILRDIVYI